MNAVSSHPPTPSSDRFDVAVLIGRFQPFHNGHASLLEQAFAVGDRVVLVLGSAGAAPSPRNPFSAADRERMIRASLSPDRDARLSVVAQRDVWDAVRWSAEVRAAVHAIAPGSTVLVGFHKDATSTYLDSFPDWTLLEAGRRGPLDATPLRELLLSDRPAAEVLEALGSCLPPGTREWIQAWAQGPARGDLTRESIAIARYREQWGSEPRLAVQALVRSDRGVLLSRRDHRPGKGLWELPGGFLLPGEQLREAARRTCRESSGIDLSRVPPVAERVFAHPGRSLRGRIVTHAFLYEPEWLAVPPPLGTTSDEVAWIPVGQIPSMEETFFEDHFHIADVLLGSVLTAGAR